MIIRILFTSLLVCLVNLSTAFAAQAGKVLSSTGSLVAISGTSQRALQRGSTFSTGELLVTGANSNAQLQLIDGSLISLTANTRYRVNDIQIQTKTTKKVTPKYSASILRGGLQNLTGSIAKEKPRNYNTDSPVATIGVRGTFWETAVIGFQQAVGCYVGQVAVRPLGGSEIIIGQGRPYQYVLITSPNATPQGLTYPPALLLSVFEPSARDLLADIRTILYKMRINRANVSPFGEEEPNLQNASSNPFAITQQQLNTLFNTTLATLPS